LVQVVQVFQQTQQVLLEMVLSLNLITPLTGLAAVVELEQTANLEQPAVLAEEHITQQVVPVILADILL
jgi:hypothetical protein